ncbi:MAG: signal peptidase II [Clostridia bacterium]|nr:signal peptidase II [Clostridia bacterium]
MTITLTLLVVALLVGFDQLTKYLVLINVKPVDAVPVIDKVIQFRYTENTGAAFSIFSEKTWLLTIFTGVMIIAGLLYLFLGKADNKLQFAALVLIISGGLGNLIDRLFRGFVVDFIEYLFMEYAVFNVADIFVTIGAVLLVVSVLFIKNGGEEKDEPTEQ